MKKLALPIAALALLALPAFSETLYKLPPKEIVDILDAPQPPSRVVSPTNDRLLLVDVEPYPPIAELARPVARLAGLRIVTDLAARYRAIGYRGLTLLDLSTGAKRPLTLPAGARITMPVWSPDGTRFAFQADREGGPALFVGDGKTGQVREIPGLRTNDVLGAPVHFRGGGQRALVLTIPKSRGAAPAEPRVPRGPNVEETAGKSSQVATYQDLLRTPFDEDLFEHFATSQLVVLDVTSGVATPVGKPGLYAAVQESPDGNYLLVRRLKRPFSFRVPQSGFPRTVEVWSAAGELLKTVADLPVTEEVPRQGVPTGPRSVEWQPMEPATLFWTEALDGGDPKKKVDAREQLVAWAAPFAGKPAEVGRVKHRFRGAEWLPERGKAIVTEYDRDRRWTTSTLLDLAGKAAPRVLIDRSAQDDYGDPGDFVLQTTADGRQTVLVDGTSAYLAGDGASEKGASPFLDRIDLTTLKKERLHQSKEGTFERFASFVKGKSAADRTKILTRWETKDDPPNLFLVDLATKRRTKVTDYQDPAPQLRGLSKQILKYERADKVPLSGTLYVPPGHQAGTRLPVIIWAYPLEYSGADTAGQVRGSESTFTRPSGASVLFFLLQGWAVLYDATMPVVGDPETMNDTFVEQVTASAKAAVDKLDAMGIADRSRVVVSGHSYGAFMTANLLAHSDLFAAGIARSGAYNRTLTPFGFQSERRSYWEATDVYTRVSPFSFAHRIKKPILLIHGEADNNSGTFPIQSERLFTAIKGNGGTARLVTLPFEAHSYRARESVLHVLAEMLEWGANWTKAKAPK